MSRAGERLITRTSFISSSLRAMPRTSTPPIALSMEITSVVTTGSITTARAVISP